MRCFFDDSKDTQKVRPVIFIDVESAPSGMKEYDYANNQSVYNAFINYLNQYGQGVKPGTYSSPWNWKISMGDFSPRTPGAYWVADYPGGARAVEITSAVLEHTMLAMFTVIGFYPVYKRRQQELLQAIGESSRQN